MGRSISVGEEGVAGGHGAGWRVRGQRRTAGGMVGGELRVELEKN
jgi:hypothetical protein